MNAMKSVFRGGAKILSTTLMWTLDLDQASTESCHKVLFRRLARASVRFRLDLALLPLVAMYASATPSVSDDQASDAVVIRGLVCEVPIVTQIILDTEEEAAHPAARFPWSPLCPTPVPNASVRLSTSSKQSFETTADERGRFALRARRPGRFEDATLQIESEGFLGYRENHVNWLLEQLAQRPPAAVVFAGLARPDDYKDLTSGEPASPALASISYPEEAWSKDVFTLRSVLQSAYNAFAATDMDGKEWTREKLVGKVVLIEFWSSWCLPCVAEVPYLREAYERFKTRGFEIIGVNRNLGTPEQQKTWFAIHGVTWPEIADGQGVQGPISQAFGVVQIPKSVLIDRQGVVVGVNLRGLRVKGKVSELLGEARPVSAH